MFEIARQGGSHIDRQRELLVAVGLAVHGQRPGPPVDVIQRQRGGLAGPQAQPSQQGHDREVASSHRGGLITGSQQSPAPGLGVSPIGSPASLHDATVGTTEASGLATTPVACRNDSNGAQRGHRRPRRRLRQAGQPAGDEGTDIGSGQRLQIQPTAPRPVGQEGSSPQHISLGRDLGQTSLDQQVVPEPTFDRLDRRLLRRRRRHDLGDRIHPAEERPAPEPTP